MNKELESKKHASKKQGSFLKQFLLMTGFVAAIYFIDHQAQIFLGQRAIDKTNMPSLSFANALAKSEQSGKPVLANFAAIWCPACRNFDNKVISEPRVRDFILANFEYVRLEYEESDDRVWFDQYQVAAFPTLLLISADEDIPSYVTHTTDIDQFIQQFAPLNIFES